MSEERKNKPHTVQAMIVALIAATLDGVIYANVAKFSRLFEGFGADLPLISRWFLQYRHVASLLMVVAIAIFATLLYARKSQNDELGWKMRGFSYLIAAFSAILFLIVVFAAYLPIFRLGATV